MSGQKDGDNSATKKPSSEKFAPKNWRQLSKKDLLKMHPQERSRYLAYEGPPKNAAKGIEASKKRVFEKTRFTDRSNPSITRAEQFEKYRHEQLIGQLKAAEARSRVRLLRMKSQRSKANEVNHLIACQPTAIKAVRLQTLLPPVPQKITVRDLLGKDERIRVQTLLEDQDGIETGRILS